MAANSKHQPPYHGLDVSDTLECVVQPTIGHVNQHFVDWLLRVLGVDAIGSSELAGCRWVEGLAQLGKYFWNSARIHTKLELVVVDIDSNDSLGTTQNRALDCLTRQERSDEGRGDDLDHVVVVVVDWQYIHPSQRHPNQTQPPYFQALLWQSE
jgi:hypothetical protein